MNRPRSKLAWICVVTSLISSMFLFALDNTILANVQPNILQSLGNVDLLPWISVSYPLAIVGVTLLVSHLFVLFDSKVLYIGSVIVFEVGSAVCGAAPNMTAFLLGRVICGLGGSGIYVGAMNLLSLMTTEAERPTYIGLGGLSWGAGTITGPLIGGAFAQSSATWRWCFYINLCVGGALAPILLFLLPSQTPSARGSIWSRLRSIDWVGAVINSGAIVSLVMAISFGGGLYPWSSGQIIGLFVCSGFLWTLFIFQQALSLFTEKQHRIFPVEYLRSRDLGLLFGSVTCASCVVFVPLYYIPLYFQFGRNDNSLQSAVRLLPLVCFQVFGTVFSGAMTSKVGYYFPWYLAGGVFSLAGVVLLFLTTLKSTAPEIYGYSILIGIGSGLYIQTGYAVAQLLVPADKIPRTVALIGYGHILGATLALAIGGSVFLNQATNMIAGILPSTPRTVVQQAITGDGTNFFQTLSLDTRDSVLRAISKCIGHVYGTVIFAGGLTIIFSLLMKRERLNFEPRSAARRPGSDEPKVEA
ncbi:major facilitator superfamily-domain-containing protein [Xylariaceae sp. FL0804]|nr:major facilitator superfamily-domain-containing protein [Xylariaceae sp. FL0804]